VDGLEAVLLSCPPQTTASDFGFRALRGANGVLPAAAPAIGWLESALKNLVLTVTNNTAVLQQLTAANLSLTNTVTALTATKKKIGGHGDKSAGGCKPDGNGGGEAFDREALAWELLLDAWPSGE
jgi:hypothetical protein